MKNIAVLTSGGDAPGMNAAIYSIVKAGEYYKINTFGIFNGYEGMIDGNFVELNSSSINNIIQRGGTILKSSRSTRFFDRTFRKRAHQQLKKMKIQGLIVLGGDGTFKGASKFSKEFDFPIIGIPCTIDNDLFGTDSCIGYDTAVNTAVDAIDKIRDTAESHNRLFFIEVMGRDAGMIAIRSGIGSGAEAILIPETNTNIKELVNILKVDWKRFKSSLIVVVAEGDEEGGAYAIAEKIKKKCPEFDIRVTILGHIQRGGKPSCADRILAIRMGLEGVESLLSDNRDVMIGIENKSTKLVPFEKAIKQHALDEPSLIHICNVMSGF
jgi:6-phosphofructokinase 1